MLFPVSAHPYLMSNALAVLSIGHILVSSIIMTSCKSMSGRPAGFALNTFAIRTFRES
jgi:hypothetical protein